MPSRSPRNILVTGGLGFIGSAFVRMLFRRDDWDGRVVNLDACTYAASHANVEGAVDTRRYTFVRGDITDGALVAGLCREHAIDCIVNFAAESHVDRSIVGPRQFIDTNIVGTFALLEVVRAQPHIHLHHISTDEVFGSLGPSGKFLETTPYAPRSPYSASKAAADHLVRAYANTYGISTTLTNCSNNYGPHQFPEKLIPLMIHNCLAGKPLPVYGDGSNVRDWIYVDDHVDAVWQVLRHGRTGESYNVGGGCELRNLDLVRQLVEIVAAEAGRDPEPLRALITFVKDRPGHDHRYAMDFSKIQSELGWRPQHDFTAGLTATVRWYVHKAKGTASVGHAR